MIKIKDYYPIAYTPKDEIYKLLNELETRPPISGRSVVDLSDIIVEDESIRLCGAHGFYAPERESGIVDIGHSLGYGQALFNAEKKTAGRFEDSITTSELLQPVIKRYGKPTCIGENGGLFYRFVLGKRTTTDTYLGGDVKRKTEYLSKVLLVDLLHLRQ